MIEKSFIKITYYEDVCAFSEVSGSLITSVSMAALHNYTLHMYLYVTIQFLGLNEIRINDIIERHLGVNDNTKETSMNLLSRSCKF